MSLARWLILLASIVLFAAGLLHVVGYLYVMPGLLKSGVDPKFLGAVKCVWLVFTVELAVLAPAFVGISRRPGMRSLLLYLALIPVIDAILMYYFVGSFIGSNMVGGGAVVLLVGAWLLPRGSVSVG
ncbi:MAG TPA: hypothetical protein VMU45_15755 [Candidatus Eisenbacteria bacterium]|nr:hypothetical protein [Candidatus Eisenbacteria bacterium]